MLRRFFFFVLALFCASPLFAFVLEGFSWTPNRSVAMQLSLGGPRLLQDGSASFNESAADVCAKWNAHLAHMQFAPQLASRIVPDPGDYENSAAFSATIFGDTFGPSTLAVTLSSMRDGITSESDTLFNSAFTWDSYAGPLQRGVEDFHRVALHEFGHNLGLDHPDDAGQTVAAIMNSTVSNVAVLQPDDIAGATALYGDGPPYLFGNDASILANISTRGKVDAGDDALIGGFIIQGSEPATVIVRAIGFSLRAAGLANPLHDPLLTIFDATGRQIAKNDDWISAANAETIASYQLDPTNSLESALLLTLDPGAYTAVISSFSSPLQPAEAGVALFELFDLHTTGGRAANISTRGQVLVGDDVLIGGFIIGGGLEKPIVVRALGPSLSGSVNGAVLANPLLELRDGNGTLLQSNDNWAQGSDADAIESEGLAPTKPLESALQATLAPGSYTAIMRGVNGGTGVGLVEIYDLSQP